MSNHNQYLRDAWITRNHNFKVDTVINKISDLLEATINGCISTLVEKEWKLLYDMLAYLRGLNMPFSFRLLFNQKPMVTYIYTLNTVLCQIQSDRRFSNHVN